MNPTPSPSLFDGIFYGQGGDDEVRSALRAHPRPWHSLVLGDFALSEEFCRDLAGRQAFTSLSIFSGRDGWRHDNLVGLLHPRLRTVHVNHLIFTEIPNPFDIIGQTVEDLDFSHTNLDEQALTIFLQPGCRLSWLKCNSTNVGLAAIDLACRIPTLRYIGVQQCGIGIADLADKQIRSGLQVGV